MGDITNQDASLGLTRACRASMREVFSSRGLLVFSGKTLPPVLRAKPLPHLFQIMCLSFTLLHLRLLLDFMIQSKTPHLIPMLKLFS